MLSRDDRAVAYARAKQCLLDSHADRVLAGTPDPQVLAAVALAVACVTGQRVPADLRALTLALQEDMVFLHDEPPEPGQDPAAGPSMRVRALSVCFPSNWRPAEKPGLDFTAIHAPVADNRLLQAGARGIVNLAFRQASMLRHVWLITPDAGLAQHPDDVACRVGWGQALTHAKAQGRRLIDAVYWRVERQTTWPLPELGAGVFFIRVMVSPLTEVLAVAPGRAAELAQALASMSEAVVSYRGMTEVRERLIDELRVLAEAT